MQFPTPDQYQSHRKPKAGAARVLLVDEDFRDLQYYRSVLVERGYDVHVLGSYEEAEHRLQKESFDFVLVGQGTSAFEGRRVVERAIKVDRRTPVVVLARCLDIGCYLEAMQLGALDYLEKPLTSAEVSRVIDTHLRTPKMVV